MKSLAIKIFSFLFVLMLAAGCASSITAPQQLPQGQKKVQKVNNPTPNHTKGDTRITDHVERPDF